MTICHLPADLLTPPFSLTHDPLLFRATGNFSSIFLEAKCVAFNIPIRFPLALCCVGGLVGMKHQTSVHLHWLGLHKLHGVCFSWGGEHKCYPMTEYDYDKGSYFPDILVRVLTNVAVMVSYSIFAGDKRSRFK